MATFPAIPQFPEQCQFLNPDDKALMLARIKADNNHVSEEDITFKEALHYLKDWKIWAG
jgi:hypothetical protein